MKTTKLICQLPGCGDVYDSRRDDSKYCCKRHRTAAWRLRIQAKEQPSSLTKFGVKDSAEIRKIKKELFEALFLIQELARREKIPLRFLIEIYEKLHTTIQTVARRADKGGAIHEHAVWIWQTLLPFLKRKVEAEIRCGDGECTLRLSTELLNRIGMLVAG